MKTLFSALRIFVLITIVTGVIYPAAVTVFAKVFFRSQADGSLIYQKDHLVGSSLIAQKFQDPKYFWPRPSAVDFATVSSGASNQGPNSGALKEAVAAREADFRKANAVPETAAVPSEMIFASGSGLDPHISPEAARLQIGRVVQARNWAAEKKGQLDQLVEASIESRQAGIFGRPRVNVLKLNLKLDSL